MTQVVSNFMNLHSAKPCVGCPRVPEIVGGDLVHWNLVALKDAGSPAVSVEVSVDSARCEQESVCRVLAGNQDSNVGPLGFSTAKIGSHLTRRFDAWHRHVSEGIGESHIFINLTQLHLAKADQPSLLFLADIIAPFHLFGAHIKRGVAYSCRTPPDANRQNNRLSLDRSAKQVFH